MEKVQGWMDRTRAERSNMARRILAHFDYVTGSGVWREPYGRGPRTAI